MHFFWRKKNYQIWGIELTIDELCEFQRRLRRSRAMKKFVILDLLWLCIVFVFLRTCLDSLGKAWINYFAGWYLGGGATAEPLPSFWQITLTVAFLFVLLGPVTLTIWFMGKWLPRYQRSVLREMGFAICVECGYDLTGAVAGEDMKAEKCAECGAELGGMVGVGVGEEEDGNR